MSRASTSPPLLEKERLTRALRELMGRLVANEIPEAVLAPMADQVEQLARDLEVYPKRRREVGPRAASEIEAPVRYDYGSMRAYSPSTGTCNPLAPPLSLAVEGDRAVACGSYGSAYEGPPGLVHGGYVAAGFDELFGLVQGLGAHGPGMTGTISVRYCKPVPFRTALRYEGWVDRVEGRKIFGLAKLTAGDLLLAEAEAVMIIVDPAMYAGLAEERNDP